VLFQPFHSPSSDRAMEVRIGCAKDRHH